MFKQSASLTEWEKRTRPRLWHRQLKLTHNVTPRYLPEMRNKWLTSLTVKYPLCSTPIRRKKNSGHACTVDGCVGVTATKEASALKLVATCQVKLTPGVLWPLCRWTMEPRIRMKHPSAVTEPVFVSAAARPLSMAALMSFSDSLSFQMHSGCFAVSGLALIKEKDLAGRGSRGLPQAVCLPEHTTTRGFLVGHLAVEVLWGGRRGRSHMAEEVG